MWSLKRDIDCLEDIEYSGRTLQRGELVLAVRTPCTDLGSELSSLTYMKFEEVRQHPAPALALEQCVITSRLGSYVPIPKSTNIETPIITIYISWPSVGPEPVRRICAGRPPGTICKWHEVNWTMVHKVRDT